MRQPPHGAAARCAAQAGHVHELNAGAALVKRQETGGEALGAVYVRGAARERKVAGVERAEHFQVVSPDGDVFDVHEADSVLEGAAAQEFTQQRGGGQALGGDGVNVLQEFAQAVGFGVFRLRLRHLLQQRHGLLAQGGQFKQQG